MKLLLIGFASLLLGVLSIIPAVAFYNSEPPKDVEFTYARIRYHMTPDAIFQREVPWHHDYPYGDETFPGFVKEVDLSEIWEWLDEGSLPLHDAVESLKFGTNYLMYALSH